MPDITMCNDKMCPMFERCYRAQAIPNPYRQSYFANSRVWNNGCNHYTPMTEETWLDLQALKQDVEEDGQRLSM